ncbi:MAG: RnfABCDGE type electron transport complex subunit D [Oscillospiraceae bacterium]|nr:RnfABCDGE type electron transport complex subunit D [Oscillospiraceae bacterium]
MKGNDTVKELTVSPSPHIHDNISTQKVMLHVIIALLPACVAGVVIFGYMALINLAVCSLSCVIIEFILRKIMKRPQTISDLSALVTGLLLGMNLPPTINPLYGIIGSFAAIAVAKQLFGGIGQNFANPAIFGRIVLMLSFTAQMSTWCQPFYYKNGVDVVTGATPLVSNEFDYMSLLLGTTGGCIGETCALALIFGGLYLISVRIITPHAPIAFIGTVALLTLISGGDPVYQILSGGLMLGAFFMATDYSTTPLTGKGKLIFGVGCGVITFAVRRFGNYPEGVSFSILLMNLLVPYIDRLCELRPIGAVKENKEAK